MYIIRDISTRLTKSVKRIWSAAKFIFPRFVNLVSVYFLRKSNTFIKSKYSKNRQWSKSIVYFGLWFGVISAFVFTYYNYRFLFSFSYIWWLPVAVVGGCVIIPFKKNFKFLNINFFKVFF